MAKKIKRTRAKADQTLAEYRADRQKKVQTQEELDRAFVGHFRNMVRGSPVGPATILLHMLVDALDRLKV